MGAVTFQFIKSPYHPGGMAENSPAFQRRHSGTRALSPEGTAEIAHRSRPSGTYPSRTPNPVPPLRDRAIIVCPAGTERASLPLKSGGIGAVALRTAHRNFEHGPISAPLCGPSPFMLPL